MYRESRIASDSAKAKAEAELNKAKKTAQELTSLIEQSNLRLKSVKKLEIDGNSNNYAQITRELEDVKQALSKLKLDVTYVLKEKVAAEKEVMELGVKTEENSKLVESLKLEVDAANEEHVLVELAKMEALKECKEVEGEKEKERKEAFESLEKMKKRKKEMKKEIKRAKEYENVLSETLADIEMLETQLKLVKDMERNVPKNQRGKDALTVLKEVTEATEAKKEELASLNAELLYLGDIMDALRKELEEVRQETARFDKMIGNHDAMIERLNAKLLIGKGKLEGVSADEERISSLADNLTCSLEKLKNDQEAAKKEEVELIEEARIIKKTETGYGGKEKELVSKLEELERAKQAEGIALEKLESMVEKTIETREMDSQSSSTITISRFEYEYLSGQARHAEETAEKKVEAAMAWVEALKASTKEIVMKTETLERESGKTMVEEERASFRMQRSLSIKRLVQNEIEKFKEESAEDSLVVSSPKPVRKSVRISGKFTPVQGGKTRRYSSGGNRGTPSYFVIKKKKKVPNLVKFFSRKRDKSSLEQ